MQLTFLGATDTVTGSSVPELDQTVDVLAPSRA